MKIASAIGVLLCLVLSACTTSSDVGPSTADAGAGLELDSREQRLSYAVAYEFREEIERSDFPFDLEAYLQGLQDAFGDDKPRLSLEEMARELQIYAAEIRYQREKADQALVMQRYGDLRLDKLSDQYRFLSQHMREDGVVTVQSGMQYKIIKEGTGSRPSRKDSVRVHFRGTLIDGSEYDSSYATGRPTVLPVARVVSGWSEALQMMREGAHWQIALPPSLAYGEYGDGDRVPPNAVLLIDIELIEVLEAEERG